MKQLAVLVIALLAFAGCANILGMDPLPGPAPDDAGSDAASADAADQ